MTLDPITIDMKSSFNEYEKEVESKVAKINEKIARIVQPLSADVDPSVAKLEDLKGKAISLQLVGALLAIAFVVFMVSGAVFVLAGIATLCGFMSLPLFIGAIVAGLGMVASGVALKIGATAFEILSRRDGSILVEEGTPLTLRKLGIKNEALKKENRNDLVTLLEENATAKTLVENMHSPSQTGDFLKKCQARDNTLKGLDKTLIRIEQLRDKINATAAVAA